MGNPNKSASLDGSALFTMRREKKRTDSFFSGFRGHWGVRFQSP